MQGEVCTFITGPWSTKDLDHIHIHIYVITYMESNVQVSESKSIFEKVRMNLKIVYGFQHDSKVIAFDC